MYSIETIKKVRNNLNSAIEHYKVMDPDAFKLCISSGNRKIGRVMNVSVAPLVTCHNCKECMFFCYDIKACVQYSNTVIDARARNTALAMVNRNEYFRRIDKAMSRRRKNKYFRWHVSGDIIDFDYFCRMVEIASNHSDFIIWTYTKYYSVVNRYCDEFGRDAIPNNFIIMFSEWDGMPLVNPYNFPVFTCKLKNGNKNHDASYFDGLHKCPGNCDICKLAKRGCVAGETTYCDEH